MLQVLEKEVRTNMKTAGDCKLHFIQHIYRVSLNSALNFLLLPRNDLDTSALIAGLETLRMYCESTPSSKITGKTIVLLSNLSGLDDQAAATELLKPILTGFNKLGAELLVV